MILQISHETQGRLRIKMNALCVICDYEQAGPEGEIVTPGNMRVQSCIKRDLNDVAPLAVAEINRSISKKLLVDKELREDIRRWEATFCFFRG